MKDTTYLEYITDTGKRITVLDLKMGHYFEAIREGQPEEIVEVIMKKLIKVDGKPLSEDCYFSDLEKAMEAVNNQFTKIKT